MFNVRLAGGHLYGKQLFTWLSLVVSLMASFVLSFFPLDVLDEIWDLIESICKGFLTYFFTVFNNMIFIVVRQEVSNLDSSVVMHELELAINRDLYGCLCSLGSQ